jgi:hypothetical protein
VKTLALYARALTLCAGTALLSACATRPDIESSTGLNAYEIAQAVRCELRDGVVELVAEQYRAAGVSGAEVLGRRNFTDPDAYKHESERFKKLFTDARAKARADAARGEKTDELTTAVLIYGEAAVAYDFELDLKNTNNTGGNLGLLQTLTAGMIVATPDASFEGQRRATRTFRIVDRFDELLSNHPTIRECNALRRTAPSTQSANGIYPIAGLLRLDRLLREFISFNQSANLVGPKGSEANPTMTETIEFTTTLKAGIEPVLTLIPVKRGLEVTGAKLTLRTERYDRHKVVVTFTLPKRDSTVTRDRSETEQAAIDELDEQRDRQLDNEALRLLRSIADR